MTVVIIQWLLDWMHQVLQIQQSILQQVQVLLAVCIQIQTRTRHRHQIVIHVQPLRDEFGYLRETHRLRRHLCLRILPVMGALFVARHLIGNFYNH